MDIATVKARLSGDLLLDAEALRELKEAYDRVVERIPFEEFCSAYMPLKILLYRTEAKFATQKGNGDEATKWERMAYRHERELAEMKKLL